MFVLRYQCRFHMYRAAWRDSQQGISVCSLRARYFRSFVSAPVYPHKPARRLSARATCASRKGTAPSSAGKSSAAHRIAAGCSAGSRATQEQEANLVAHQGRGTRDIRSHRDRPVRELVPGKQIARKGEQKRNQQQRQPENPVEWPVTGCRPVLYAPVQKTRTRCRKTTATIRAWRCDALRG